MSESHLQLQQERREGGEWKGLLVLLAEEVLASTPFKVYKPDFRTASHGIGVRFVD